MTEKKTDSGEYALRVRDNTTRYAKELLDENERLRARVAALETELARHHSEKQNLEQKLTVVEAESRRQLEQYVEVEMQNSNVANLYVASFRLHGTLDRGQVLTAIHEIVVNLIGSEEVGVYELDEETQELKLASSFGLDAARWETVPLGAGIIGQTAVTGEVFVREGDPRAMSEAPPTEADLTACIPLRLDGRITGAVAIFRVLEHKRRLEEVDHELFDLLARQAATALYCTALHAGKKDD